jgi:hypothetical protein
MSRIYISYRRGDASEAAGEIYDYLCNLGVDVGMEPENIPAGGGVREHIDGRMKSAGAVIAVIGQRWLEKIHDDRDLVRTELECALQRKIPIIPAIVDGGRMPRTSELPRTLRELPYLNAAIVRGPPLVRDMDPLTHAITPFASRTSRPPPGMLRGKGAEGDIAHRPRRSASFPSGMKPAISFVVNAWGRFRAWMARG